jgi:uncharacterized membrane protein YadS
VWEGLIGPRQILARNEMLPRRDGKCKPRIEFTLREVLRVGVALQGMRITFSQMAALGWARGGARRSWQPWASY